ncbi:MAG: hypothetical protein EBE86_007445 [Hormoscilla sp. GUM202]|nr:hypothetical protein [Hormoscilla sp. GUM202]
MAVGSITSGVDLVTVMVFSFINFFITARSPEASQEVNDIFDYLTPVVQATSSVTVILPVTGIFPHSLILPRLCSIIPK